MLVTYMRSSSVNCYAMCPQKYFCTYVLGLKDKDNGKACQGNVFHKNFEILAKCKLAQQNGEKYFIDDNFGKLSSRALKICPFGHRGILYSSNIFDIV